MSKLEQNPQQLIDHVPSASELSEHDVEIADQGPSYFYPPEDKQDGVGMTLTEADIQGINFAIHKYDRDKAEEYLGEQKTKLGPEAQDVISSIVLRGEFIDRHIDPPEAAQRNAGNTLKARMKFADIALLDPDAAEIVASRGVFGYHGTRSAALASILRSGYLGSGAHVRTHGSIMMTGEHIYQTEEGQKGISFSTLDQFDNTMSQYAGSEARPQTLEEMRVKLDEEKVRFANNDYEYKLRPQGKLHKLLETLIDEQDRGLKILESDPNSLEAELAQRNFPVVFGVGSELVERMLNDPANVGKKEHEIVMRGSSDLSEVRLLVDKIDKSDLPVMLVPDAEVDRVERLCKQFVFENTKVLSLEAFYNQEAA